MYNTQCEQLQTPEKFQFTNTKGLKALQKYNVNELVKTFSQLIRQSTLEDYAKFLKYFVVNLKKHRWQESV
jgi:hypothetical protein